ncbi:MULTISPECIES: M23 family metallopeptidase [Pseudomonas]|jgi:hydroxyethylthiazole kinase|uniref:M23 family metallopeptidase n=1 Tax=Pseudomonas TaxID=286 RepID=UPI000F04A9CB|nr:MULTISPECIES: M23 family metallopeptidase [Pseudomonas]MBH3442159.1 M23 family metallopeptidase [Pseudomonas moraviensis]RRW51878.1 hypothetical protein EGJ55_23390 [Pseudomonas moraviensis]GLH20569.1 hypothetical protein BR1R3_33110 [Pseudomonas atacamensis]
MIISPPFIPAPVAGETDDAYLARAMVGGIPGDGGYPLSFDLNWHGGIHLTAPQEGGSSLPVRAISDGTLVYFRQPTLESATPPDHALRYRNKWTDDGCVVIRHETEIGEGEKAKVVFFSIYMHLSKILIAGPQKGKSVSRKDKIGEAGSIYGENGRIHFEIVADQSQIANLVGREGRDLQFQTGHGRSDSVWGDMYFFIPPEVLVYERAPQNILSAQNESSVIYRCPAMPAGPAPIQEAGAPSSDATNSVQGYDWSLASELQNGMFVRMSFAKGQCKLTTYSHSGFELGSQSESGSYEYDLYNVALERFPKSPSAGFELLRFGRILGGDQLVPADAAHWRRIKIPGKVGEESKTGWVDFNSFSVTKFSDADFPHWQGWQLVDDDADSDSHCQSPFIRAILSLDVGKVVSDNVDAVSIAKSPAYLTLSADEQKNLSDRYVVERQLTQSLLEKTEVQERIKRLVCKFPSEWCKNDFDTRYDWLKKVAEGGPLPEDQYSKLKSHQQALGFWEEAALAGIDHMHWHFPPKEFIRFFRKCGWLTKSDMKGIYPAASDANVSKYIIHINKTLSKYLIVGGLRRSHFFGQAGIESNQLVSMSELYNGNDPYEYFRRYANASNYNGWLGNIKYNDGGDFRGRGFKQLTGRANYANYWVYRGWLQASSFTDNWWKHTAWWGITISGPTVPAAQQATLPIQNAATIAQLDAQFRPPVIVNADRVKNEPFTCIDTAGWFWAKNRVLELADSNNIPNVTRRIRGDRPAVGTASVPWPAAANFSGRETLTNKLLQHF